MTSAYAFHQIQSLQQAGFDLPLSLAVIAGVFVLYAIYLMLSPLLEEGEISSEEWSRMEDESLAILNRRDRVIAELKDLEFEAAMNKIDDADLSRLKHQYEREALRLIEALDQRASDYADDIQGEISATREAARARKASESNATDEVSEVVADEASAVAADEASAAAADEASAAAADEASAAAADEASEAVTAKSNKVLIEKDEQHA